MKSKKKLRGVILGTMITVSAFHGWNSIQQPLTVHAAAKTYKVTANLNMRSKANLQSKVILILKKGKKVKYIKKSGNWYQVKYGTKIGWVYKSYVKAIKVKRVSEDNISAVESKQIRVNKTHYNLSLNEMVNLQYQLHGQTDAYRNYFAYVSKSAATYSGHQVILKTKVNILSSDSSKAHVYATGSKGQKLTYAGTSGKFYRVYLGTWRNATKNDILENVNPEKIGYLTQSYFQFIDLSKSIHAKANELNKVLQGKGALEGKATSYQEAASTYHINEAYLIVHSMLETGNGTSELATGVKVSKVNGKKVPTKTVYNMYGIGAYDSTALTSGAEYAYKQGWFTPEKAIIGGAKFISMNYINNSKYHQNTLYKMRWNPECPGIHQYATDIGWASKQTSGLYTIYQRLSEYEANFDVPVYK